MKKENLEKLKEILNKFGHDPPPEELLEIKKNIETLANLIKDFNKRHENKKD